MCHALQLTMKYKSIAKSIELSHNFDILWQMWANCKISTYIFSHSALLPSLQYVSSIVTGQLEGHWWFMLADASMSYLIISQLTIVSSCPSRPFLWWETNLLLRYTTPFRILQTRKGVMRILQDKHLIQRSRCWITRIITRYPGLILKFKASTILSISNINWWQRKRVKNLTVSSSIVLIPSWPSGKMSNGKQRPNLYRISLGQTFCALWPLKYTDWRPGHRHYTISGFKGALEDLLSMLFQLHFRDFRNSHLFITLECSLSWLIQSKHVGGFT